MMIAVIIASVMGILIGLYAIGLSLRLIILTAYQAWKWRREAPMRAARKAVIESKLK